LTPSHSSPPSATRSHRLRRAKRIMLPVKGVYRMTMNEGDATIKTLKERLDSELKKDKED
jgi:hypothetical protein